MFSCLFINNKYYSYYKKTDIRKVGVLIDGQYIFGDDAVNKIGVEVAEKRNLRNRSFRDFLSIIEEESEIHNKEKNLNQIDHPYQPQYKYLVNEEEQIIVDFIGKYENIQSDWMLLCEYLQLNKGQFRTLSLPHHNKSNHDDYRTYYDDNDAERVYNIYKKDIELFDYSRTWQTNNVTININGSICRCNTNFKNSTIYYNFRC